MLQEKLIQAIRRIQHEVELCREAERETYVESVDVEVLQFYAFESHRMIGVWMEVHFPQNHFDALEREIKAEFQNLHRFLEEEECKDLERLRREEQKQVKLLKQRERKIAAQGKDLERAIAVLNSKLCEEDSPKLLKVRKN